MAEIIPVTKDQLFEKKIAENTGSDYNVGDISDVVPVTKDQSFLKEIALNLAGQSEDIAELEAKVSATQDMLSDAYNSTHTYNVGDYCIYENVLYKCNTAIAAPEAFTPAKWTATNIGDVIAANTKDIGLLSNLDSIDKSNLVSAINEVKGTIKTAEVTTGDINDILADDSSILFVTVLAQAGGFSLTNWIGNVDGFIVKLGLISIAFSGWDLSIRPYYKLNWGGSAASWSQWYQF